MSVYEKSPGTTRLEHSSGGGKNEDDFVFTDADEKSLVRRIDLHLLPLMITTYMLQYFDKTTLGTFHLFNHLKKSQSY